MAMTKAMARLQTREDILKRKQALTAEVHDSDKEDTTPEKDEKKDKVTQLMENTEKVRLDDFELLKVHPPLRPRHAVAFWIVCVCSRNACLRGVGARPRLVRQGDASPKEEQRKGVCHEDPEEEG